LLLSLVFLLACSEEAPEPETDSISYNIDTSRISVSGVSSGAYMAGQLHLTHSSIFMGAAIVAGGPYYCAMGELSRGLGTCLTGDEPGSEPLLAYAQAAAAAGTIDDLANLQDDRVWIFHGKLDSAVAEGPSRSAAVMYGKLMAEDAVTLVTDIAVVHGWPTLDTGQACDAFGTPFLYDCDYDAAGEILKTLYGKLHDRRVAGGELLTIAQPGYDAAEMLPDAYLYVPVSCAAGTACGIHVAIHGCSQSSGYVGDVFAAGAGFNEWADSNNLLVLYPQVASSKLAPMNPYGCWDWWGYTDENYANRQGPQVAAIKATLDALAGTTL